MIERDAYRRKLDTRDNEYAARLRALKARVKQALVEGRIAREPDEAEIKLEVARAGLRDLSEAWDEAWENVKSGFESVRSGMTDAWEKASDRFK